MFLMTVIGLGNSPGFGWKDPSGTTQLSRAVETLPPHTRGNQDYRGHVTVSKAWTLDTASGHPQARPPGHRRGHSSRCERRELPE